MQAEPDGPDEGDTAAGGRRSCSWCGRVEIDGMWVERAFAPQAEGREAHSVCPDCFASLIDQ